MIDCCIKKINILSSILLLMGDIWNLPQSLNIFVCYHAYKEANKTTSSLPKKGLSKLDLSAWWLNFLKDVTNVSFYDYCGFLSNNVCKLFGIILS